MTTVSVHPTTSEQNECEAFENSFNFLDLDTTTDAFSQKIYKHVHVESIWCGFKDAWQHQQKRIDVMHKTISNYENRVPNLEKTIESLQVQLTTAVAALDKIQRLGNEPHVGNSIGNSMATEAIAEIKKLGE
jgi:uncharacterized protein YaaN involved in tellurite resistance